LNQGELYLVDDGVDHFTGDSVFITGSMDLGDQAINGSICGATGLSGSGHNGVCFLQV
jgi:hypothetical protein